MSATPTISFVSYYMTAMLNWCNEVSGQCIILAPLNDVPTQLNIGGKAVRHLQFGSVSVSFECRIKGVVHNLDIRYEDIVGIIDPVEKSVLNPVIFSISDIHRLSAHKLPKLANEGIGAETPVEKKPPSFLKVVK